MHIDQQTYHIAPISQIDFYKMESQWQHCLKQSEANPLFSSWIWQKTWWEIWQPRLNLTLFLLGIYEQNSLNEHTLIGIVPCHTYISNNRLNLKHTRCEWIGAYSANDDSIRSEYLNFILPAGLYDTLLPIIFNYFTQHVDEIKLRDLAAKKQTAQWLKHHYSNASCTQDTGIKIPTSDDFSTYLTRLGKNTRLKLFNRRKKLQTHHISSVNSKQEVVQFFKDLNSMHLKRWGKICFSEHSVMFHSKVSEYYLKQQQLNAICLYENYHDKKKKLQAVCYDITIDNVRYNLQLGFYPYPNDKVSMGTLMLGFAIEQAHKMPSVKYYDLLAGNGKNTNYKLHFKGDIQTFISFSIPLTYRLKMENVLKKKYHQLKQLVT